MTDQNQPPVPPQQSTPPVPPAPPAAPQYQAAPPPPAYGAAGSAGPAGAAYGAAPVPGKTLGIIGLIVAIAGFFIFPVVAPIVGLILSIIARKQSREAGVPNGPAKAGLIVSIIGIVLGIIGTIIVIVSLVAVSGALLETCQQLGPGVHEVGGTTYNCS